MNCPSKQLFAGSALAEQQHGEVPNRRTFCPSDGKTNCTTVSDNPLESSDLDRRFGHQML
jgi:hypothetical protein